jgi:ubiquinone biosynthesis protein
LQQFSPWRLAQDGLRKAPELVEVLARTPTLIAEGMRFLERQTRRTPENPFAGIRGTIFGGFCLLAGAIIASSGGSWVLSGGLFFIGLFLAMRRGG